jgi:hypothetical protein
MSVRSVVFPSKNQINVAGRGADHRPADDQGVTMKALVAFIFGGFLVWVVTGWHRHEKVSAVSVPAVAERAPTLEEQDKCARQAREEFSRGGWKVDAFTNFSDHYNPKLGKCFYEVVDSSMAAGHVPSSSKMVGDAFEGTVYAQYGWINSEGKPFWQVAPYQCSVDGETCKSSGEFDELVARNFGIETDR